MADRNSKDPWKKNQWGKGKNISSTAQDRHVTKPSIHNAETRFKEASEKLQASAQKHIQHYESSSDEEDLEKDNILDGVLGNYVTDDKEFNLGRTKDFLTAICLICIESVKRNQPIWNCSTCFNGFHLLCIQRWANDTIYQQNLIKSPTLSGLPVRDNTFKEVVWCCPKCRCQYNQDEVPKTYECFCKKQKNPEIQPWLVPHSCGAICSKPLTPKCGDLCLLLCHPGPCPPCPKLVHISCNCEKSLTKPVRCSVGNWSCNKICEKLLCCNIHKCDKTCHPGECQPCPKIRLQKCLCKKKSESVPCAKLTWQCDNICGKLFSCGYHKCNRLCHDSNCGPCPFTGSQKCPCGSTIKDVTCPDKVTSCGGTCNKELICGIHQCPLKCHLSPEKCSECQVFVEKSCRCGSHVKELPCHKEFLCQTKCKNMKECGRHPCNKKCCDGDCSTCNKICEKTLQCKKHKCPSACHTGPCYPCPLQVKVTCFCGNTYFNVPCGRQKRTKPPKCSRNCRIPASCNHVKENVHSCHFEDCPPCKQTCGKLLSCKHICYAHCHNAVQVIVPAPKATGPWDQLAPKVQVKALPCPPCKVPVVCSCLGRHEESKWPCSTAKVSSCGRICGQLLPCTNHACSRECHNIAPGKCENCERQCELSRPEGCTHPCTKQCHPSPCGECQQFLKRSCHCGLTELFIKCFALTSSDSTVKEQHLSCQQRCIKLLKCGHRCSTICHSGVCTVKICQSKTRMYCACRRIKKDIACNLISKKEPNVSCDELCKKKMQEELLVKEEEIRRIKLEEDEKNRIEIAKYESKFGKKIPKNREKRSVVKQEKNFFLKYWFVFISIIIGVAAMFIILFVNHSEANDRHVPTISTR